MRRLVRPALMPLAVRALNRRTAKATSIDDYLDVAYGFEYGGTTIEPWQAHSEIRRLLTLLSDRPPKTVVEIGTGTGGSLYLFARAAARDATLVSIDLPHGEFGGGYALWRAPLYRAFAGPRQKIELVRGDSHAPATRERVAEILDGREIDFLFIDGDHTYDGVQADFEMYSPLVADDGIIGFHDIVPGERLPDPAGHRGVHSLCVGDVPQFWRDLRDRFDVDEFVEDWDQASFGIGVVRKSALITHGADAVEARHR